MPASYGDLTEWRNLENLKTRLMSDWQPRNDMIEEMRQLRYMENTIEVPADMEAEEVRSPEGNQIVERMVGTLTSNPMIVHIPPASEDERMKRKHETTERWLLAAMDKLEKQADQDVRDLFVESLIIDGHGCMRMLYAPQLWKGMPRRDRKNDEGDDEYSSRVEVWKKGKDLPIAWNWIDPLTAFPLFGEFGLEGMMVVDRRDILTLPVDRWDDPPDLSALSRLAQTRDGSVEFVQWWDSERLIYAVENEVVHVKKHRYESPPFTYAFGLGSASNEPEKMGTSVLWPLRKLLPALDRALSQRATAVRIWCWPTAVYRRAQPFRNMPIGEDDSPVHDIDLHPGGLSTLYEGEDLTFLVWQGNPAEIDKHIAYLQSAIQKAGLADPVQGMPSGDSGYAINQLIAAARMRFQPISKHARRAIEKQLCALLDIVEYQIKQPLHIYQHKDDSGWLTLSPDDLQGYRNLIVKMEPLLPTDEYAKSSKVINEINARIKSRERGMEEIGIEQPDEEMRRILVEEAKAAPEFHAMLTQEALRRAGLQLAQGGMGMQQLQNAYPDLPPGLQQTMTDAFAQTAPQGASLQDIGMPGPPPGTVEGGGPPGMGAPSGAMGGAMGGTPGGAPGGVPMQNMEGRAPGAPQDQMAQLQQAMDLINQIAQAVQATPEQIVQFILQKAQETGMPVMEILMALAQHVLGQSARMPGSSQAPGMAEGGPMVMGNPQTEANPHVGRVVRPSGIGTGRQPGPRQTGME